MFPINCIYCGAAITDINKHQEFHDALNYIIATVAAIIDISGFSEEEFNKNFEEKLNYVKMIGEMKLEVENITRPDGL